jgi:hypothetical protein
MGLRSAIGHKRSFTYLTALDSDANSFPAVWVPVGQDPLLLARAELILNSLPY